MNATPEVAGRPLRSRGLLIAAGAAVTLCALAVMAGLSRVERSPGWSGPAAGITFAVAVVILLKLTSATNSIGSWLAVSGGALVLLGSGLTRSRREVSSRGRGSGAIFGRLDTWWPVLVAGIVIGLLALLVASSRGHNAIDRAQSATLAVVTLSLGTVVVVLLVRDVVVGHWIEGRPVRRRGRLVLPPARQRSDSPARDAWLAAADHERAAIAAFTNLAVRLHEVGAPVELIDRCRRAASDETRHVRQCVRLAGYRADPRPSTTAEPTLRARRPVHARSRRIALMRIALESFADGVVNEGFAAERLQRSAARTGEETARVLRRMARDERRHASLAADIVRWCASESGFLLEAALLATATRLPDARPFPVGIRDLAPSTLAASGLPDPSSSAAAWAATRVHARRWLARQVRRAPCDRTRRIASHAAIPIAMTDAAIHNAREVGDDLCAAARATG
jgi:hypothetical protein